MTSHGQRAYECPNPKCKSKNLVPIGGDPRNRNRRGKPQLVYECQDCGWKVGEIMLKREWSKRASED